MTDFPLVYTPANDDNSLVIVEDNKVVSHAAVWPRKLVVHGEQLKLGVIVSVATHPDFRNRGFAASLMRELQQRMLEQNYDLAILWTGVPAFYQQLGWKVTTPLGWLIEIDRKITSHPMPIEGHARLFRPTDDVAAVGRLFDEYSIRFARNSTEMRNLLTLPKVDTLVFDRGGSYTAYLVYGKAVNKRGIIEYGGELDGVLALIQCVTKRFLPASLIAFHARPDLIQWATESGFELRPL